MRVLVVEDEEALCRATKRVMAAVGHTTKCVDRMSDCAAAVVDFDPEIVILDLGLPDTQGPETLEAMLGLTDVPIIIFSAEPMWMSECLRLGAREFLTKGEFTPMDLPPAVHRAVGRDRLTKVLDKQDQAARGEASWPGQPTTDPGKVGDRLLSLAGEMKLYAGT